MASDGWTTLLKTGLALLEQFAETSRAPLDAPGRRLHFAQRDPEPGQDYLKIPMPSTSAGATCYPSPHAPC